MWYYSTFPSAIPLLWAGYSRVTRPSATVHPLYLPEGFNKGFLVRLACVRHAASVRPEPGSNSRSVCILKIKSFKSNLLISLTFLRLLICFSEFFVCKKLSK